MTIFKYEINFSAYFLARRLFGLLYLVSIFDHLSVYPSFFGPDSIPATIETPTLISFYDPFSQSHTWLYFTLMILSALGLIFNFFPRICSLVAWLLSVALIDHLKIVTFGVDSYFRSFLLLYAVQPDPTDRGDFPRWYRFLFYVQIGAIYFFACILKDPTHWLIQRDAVQLILSSRPFGSEIGHFIANWPKVCEFLTIGVWTLELMAGLFIFAGVRSPKLFWPLFWSLVVFHISSTVFMSLNLLPFIAIAILITLTPTSLFVEKLKLYFDHFNVFNRVISIKFSRQPNPRLVSQFAVSIFALTIVFSSFQMVIPLHSKEIYRRLLVAGLIQKWNLFTGDPTYSGEYKIHLHGIPGSNIDTVIPYEANVARWKYVLLSLTGPGLLSVRDAIIAPYCNQPNISHVYLVRYKRTFNKTGQAETSHMTVAEKACRDIASSPISPPITMPANATSSNP